MPKRTLHRFIAAAYISFVFATSACFFLVALAIWLVTRPFDRRLWLLHRFTCLWASLYIWVFPPWSVKVHGRNKVDRDKTYVIVSNHQSLVDILAAFTLFIHFKWVSKSELFMIPLIGWNMTLNRYISLKRGQKAGIKRMYAECERHLREGSSIFLFPEGTRSVTGRMRDFKEGAFVLAKRLNVPILPLVISGSKDAVPKNSLNYHGRSDIRVRILDEIRPGDFATLSVEELRDAVQALIRRHLPDERSSPAAEAGLAKTGQSA